MQINNRKRLQDGGLLRPYTPATPTTKKLPATSPSTPPPQRTAWDNRITSDMKSFQEKVPKMKNVQGDARLHYYKGILDKQLEAKNPEAYRQAMSTPRDSAIASRVHAADSLINNKKYNYSISDEEIRNTPGVDYEDFNNLRNTLSTRFNLDVAGAGEASPISAGTAYGLRNSWSISPASAVYKNTLKEGDNVYPTSDTEAEVIYDPVTKGYKYNYKTTKVYPDTRKKVFAHGGNLVILEKEGAKRASMGLMKGKKCQCGCGGDKGKCKKH